MACGTRQYGLGDATSFVDRMSVVQLSVRGQSIVWPRQRAIAIHGPGPGLVWVVGGVVRVRVRVSGMTERVRFVAPFLAFVVELSSFCAAKTF